MALGASSGLCTTVWGLLNQREAQTQGVEVTCLRSCGEPVAEVRVDCSVLYQSSALSVGSHFFFHFPLDLLNQLAANTMTEQAGLFI